MKLRLFYTILLLVLVPLGLASRYYFKTGLFHTYGGDVLYATFFYFCFRFLQPSKAYIRAISYSLLFCYCIEISQFYHEPWIDAIRKNFLGGLILGFGFLWSDIICYTLGVALGFGFDLLLARVIETQEKEITLETK